MPATTAKPIDDGGARLLVEDDEMEGKAVVAVLLRATRGCETETSAAFSSARLPELSEGAE
jgi:hypothetical protein